MNDLDLIKRIAEIEGVNAKISINRKVLLDADRKLDPTVKHSGYHKYNPLKDKALNCELRDKYNVEVNYGYKTCSIYAYSYFGDGSLRSCASIVSVDFNSKEEIPRAVLLCIIEAKANEY